MSVNADIAGSYASSAADATGEERRTDAIGEGLAAIAYALLDVAEAIRDTTPER